MERRGFLKLSGCFVGAILLGCDERLSGESGQSAKADGVLKVVVLDSSLGGFVCESILLSTPNGKHVLVDAAYPSGFTLPAWGSNKYGDSPVVAYLKEMQVNHLDAIILSHPHDDHMGGVSEIIESGSIAVDKLIWSTIPDEKMLNAEPSCEYQVEMLKSIRESCSNQSVDVVELKKGQRIEIDKDVWFDTLAVAEPQIDVPNYINNNSVIMKLCYKDFSMLLTGDAGFEQENRMLEANVDLSCDVLKVGHHGGAGSSSAEFLDAVKPEIAIASLPQWLSNDSRGKRVAELITSRNIKYYQTWENGNVELHSDGRKYWVVSSK